MKNTGNTGNTKNTTNKDGRGVLREFGTLGPYIAKYRFKYIAGFACLFAIDAAQLAIPQFTKAAINLVSQDSFRWADVLRLCLAMVAAMALISFGRFLWRLFIHGSSRRIEAELRQNLFDHLLTLSWDFYQRNKIGDLIARSTSDLHAVRMAIGWGLVAGIDGSVMALSILAIIFVEDAPTAMFAVLPLPLITVLIIFFGKAAGRRFKRAQEANSALSETVQETFAGIRVVKSFVKEAWFVKRFADNNEDYRAANMEAVKLQGFFMPLISFLAGLTSVIVLFAGGRRVVLGLMTPGQLVALFSYTGMMIWPMLGAGFTVNILQRGAVSLKRINDILNEQPSIRNPPVPVIKPAVQPAVQTDSGSAKVIELRNLSFSYGGDGSGADGADALRGVNIALEEGATLGILGRTGSGKSTLIKLLTRTLDPPRGTVFVKGVDVRDWDIEALRALFGVSPQDSFMFSDSIRNNIVYGVDGRTAADDALIKEMTELAALDRDAEMFADGIGTLIGERGLTLSGGQKQRLAIARAVITRPEILILDDSLSAVDAETETRIVRNLKAERRGRTTIIISHRVSAFANADFAAVLEEGVLAEYGTPKELLKRGGYYAKTAELQQLCE